MSLGPTLEALFMTNTMPSAAKAPMKRENERRLPVVALLLLHALLRFAGEATLKIGVFTKIEGHYHSTLLQRIGCKINVGCRA